MPKTVKCLIRKQFTKKEHKVKNILRMLNPSERKIMLQTTLIFYFLFFLKYIKKNMKVIQLKK